MFFLNLNFLYQQVSEFLDAYLGDLPDNIEDFEFNYKGKVYNPKSFAKSLGLNMDDYVSLTSFNHHPYYSNLF